jgi:hypothetical protein
MARADRLIRIEDGQVTRLGVRVQDRWSFARERQSAQSVIDFPQDLTQDSTENVP